MGQWGRIKTVPLPRYKGRPTNEKISIEVQTVKHWEKAIESFRLDYNVDIYITGSNAYLLDYLQFFYTAEDREPVPIQTDEEIEQKIVEHTLLKNELRGVLIFAIFAVFILVKIYL